MSPRCRMPADRRAGRQVRGAGGFVALVAVGALLLAGCANTSPDGSAAATQAVREADGATEALVAAQESLGPAARELVGRHSVVVGTASLTRLVDQLRLAESGTEHVARIWGERLQLPVVLVVPQTAAQFAALTGHVEGEDQVAATTVGSGGRARVVLHPDAPGRLTPAGLRAVIRHEIAHVAMRGPTTGAAPTWLSEGLAEYTAHLGSGVGVDVLAGPVLQAVRAGAGPAGLPTEQQLDPADGPIAAGYATSWLVCRFVAEHWSQEHLIRLHDTVVAGTPIHRSVPRVLGVTQEELTSRWLSWLGELAAGPA